MITPTWGGPMPTFAGKFYVDHLLAGAFLNGGENSQTMIISKKDSSGQLLQAAENHLKRISPDTGELAQKAADPLPYPHLTAEIDRQVEAIYDRKLRTQLSEMSIKLYYAANRAILYGIPFKKYAAVPTDIPLVDVLVNRQHHQELAHFIQQQVLPKMADGEVILNPNIPFTVLKQAGVDHSRLLYELSIEEEGKQERKVNRGQRK
ncbi:hypothetical protein [Olivibacter jilunii]|uniref:hypothetical protein n=1 Tax=Olivibacter jilunii TaxID=985016 RepID=UPI0010302981|nr:hypothetical protein [Olivibacter jilunii]